jgi:hypothetical protein
MPAKNDIPSDELVASVNGSWADRFPPVLTANQLAEILAVSVKTIYFWKSKNRFAGACRKRGKHLRFRRDKALKLFFDGPEWTNARQK